MSAIAPPVAAPPEAAANPRRIRLIGLAVLLVAACALPFLVSNYRTFQFTLVLVYAIALLGLNILTGYNGQISLGHGAFYAIGAYVAAILMDRFGVPYWATVPIAGALCLVVGFLFGLPALRLEGHYLALATFALGVTMPQLLKNKYVEHWTGGVQGIVIVKPDAPFGLKLSPDQWLYLFTLVITVARFVIGGLASLPGAVFGAVFIQFIPTIADQISKAAPWAIYGIFLIGFMFQMPMGINGAIRLGWARFRHRKSAQREGG